MLEQVQSFPLSALLPGDLGEFYRYNGSLTQPNHCPEVVQVLLVVLVVVVVAVMEVVVVVLVT